MQKLIGITLIVVATATVAAAVPPTPEIDPANCASAFALLAGAVLVIRGRRRK